MSSGFAGGNTKSFAKALDKRLDVFTDEFDPPNTPADTVPGQDTSKGKSYQKPHDDGAGKTDLPVNRRDREERILNAGNVKDQPSLDDLDREVQEHEGKIKKPADQFPTGYDSDRLDRLKSETKKALGMATKFDSALSGHKR
jgi:hypothetical protein